LFQHVREDFARTSETSAWIGERFRWQIFACASGTRVEDFLEKSREKAELTVTDFGIPARRRRACDGTHDNVSFLRREKCCMWFLVCHDAPGQIRAHLSKREDLDRDDGVGILLDNVSRFSPGLLFYSNPLGVQTDAIYTEGLGYDSASIRCGTTADN